jgi:hypothetical protein
MARITIDDLTIYQGPLIAVPRAGDEIFRSRTECRSGARARRVPNQPGTYVFVCNLPGPYRLGMRAALVVQ